MNAFTRSSRMVWLAVAAACATTLFRPLFGGSGLFAAIIAAALAALAVELGVRTRLSALQAMVVHVVALVLVGQAVLFTRDSVFGFPTAASMRAITSAMVNGWSDLLTVALPAPARDGFLVAPFVVTWLAVLGGSRLTALGAAWSHLIACVAAAAVALAFGPADAPLYVAGTAALVMVALAYLARSAAVRVRARPNAPDDEQPWWRRQGQLWSPAVTPLALVAVLAVFAAPAALGSRGSERSTLRSLVEPPFNAASMPSPLAEFKGYLAADRADTVALDIRSRSTPLTLDHLRMVPLDAYDGLFWAVGAPSSALAGTFQELRSSDSSKITTAAADVTVQQFSGRWLPMLGSDSYITSSGSLARRAKASDKVDAVVVPDGLRAGDAYTVHFVPSKRPTAAALRSVDVDLSSGIGGATELPPSVRTLTEAVAAKSPSPSAYDRVSAVADHFVRNGYVDPSAVPGHSLGRLAQFTAGAAPVGSGEQFAATAALMVRSMGMPVRVAVGFNSAAPPAQELIVRNRDIAAWIEVRFENYGWVPFDVTPPSSRKPDQRLLERLARQNSIPQGATAPPPPQESATRLLPRPKTSPQPTAVGRSWRVVIIGVGSLLGVMALVAGYLGLVALSKRRRRRRRRLHPDPYHQVLGAFDEVMDRHAELGWRPSGSSSLRQIGTELGPEPGAVAMRRLTSATEQATFHPGVPGPELVQESWQAAEQVIHGLNGDARMAERLRALADPRPLFGMSRRG